MNVRELEKFIKSVNDHIQGVKANIVKYNNSQDLGDIKNLKDNEDLLMHLESEKKQLENQLSEKIKQTKSVHEDYQKAVEDLEVAYQVEAVPLINKLQEYLEKKLKPAFFEAYEKLLEKDNRASSKGGELSNISGRNSPYNTLMQKNHFYFKTQIDNILKSWMYKTLEDRKKAVLNNGNKKN